MFDYVKMPHILSIADHKIIIIDLSMEDLKSWGDFYWKLNTHF